MARDLENLGFKHLYARSLKPKHVCALIEHWQARGLSDGMQKQNMVHLRWWAEKVQKNDLLPKTNSALGIGKKTFVTEHSKSLYLSEEQLLKIKHPWLRLALRLQQEFGLRREEALKFRPSHAIKDDRIELMKSWCKGGRARTVPISLEQQVMLLEEIKSCNFEGSLMPSAVSFKQGIVAYENQTHRAGFRRLHGLRCGYAERRYQTLAKLLPPVLGGPHRDELVGDQIERDEKARITLARELGHNRIDVTYAYIGR